MAELSVDQQPTPIAGRGLSATVNLAQVTWSTIIWWSILAIGSCIRLFQIGALSLSPEEARKAFDSWSLFYGATEGPYQEPTTVEPAGLLLRAITFFLFGTSDTTARIMSAILGIALIGLIWSIRDLLGNMRALGAAALVAFSPTLVFASRTVNEEIVTLFFALLLLVTVFRIGDANRHPGIGRAVVLGLALAGLVGSGPAGISVLLVLALTMIGALFVAQDRGATFRSAVGRLTQDRTLLIGFVASLVLSTITMFTRFFTDPGAISGLGEIFGDWGRMVASEASETPTQFFILSILLYEIVAIAFAVKSAIGDARQDSAPTQIDWTYPAVWFLGSLLLFSFSSGRSPEQAVLVTFPLLLLAGMGLGDAIDSLLENDAYSRRAGILLLTVMGVTIAFISTLVLVGRVDTAIDRGDAITQVIAAAVVALGPLVILAYSLGDQLGRGAGWAPVRSAVLLGITAVLSIVMFRSVIELSFYRPSLGNELLGQHSSAADLRDVTQRIANLSRDINGTDRSPANPAGGKEMTIRVDRTVQWPFRWYLRDFPNMEITAPGAAPAEDVQLVIAPDPSNMTEAGYQPRVVDAVTNPAPSYVNPSIGSVLKYVFVPSKWDQGLRFILYRDPLELATPKTVVFGYASDVVSVMTGERPTYQLFDRAGPGSNAGQFNQPRGVAISPDGLRVYVLDTQNNRIQVFDAESGELLGIWGDGEGDDVSLALTDNGLGPYGLTVGADGVVYIADTWNHRIVVVNPDGQVVRMFGEFGNNEDSPDPTINTATFYGPRGVAVYGNEIFVTDTGNERVEVFGLDGTFLRSFGGTGSGPDQLLEPVGIAVGSDGIVYVADSGNARISAFDVNGTPIAQWPVANWVGQQFYEPYIAIGSDGSVYASSPTTASVLVFDQNGTLISELIDADGTPLQLPAGLAFSPSGDLFVADRGSSEIYVITSPESPAPDEVIELPGSESGSPVASPQASPEASPQASPAM